MKRKTTTWYQLAKSDLEMAESLSTGKNRFFYCVHFCHQAIEKILKAAVQEYSEILPLRTHNLPALARQTKLKFNQKQTEFLLRLNPHYLGTKYPEDINALYKTYTKDFATKIYKETKEFFQWLEKKLQS
ncbi:HEPN domain-containing protein [Candidatus Berkelbacteria bacterium]|nr:HEPN domain-containing protein [Candidatus Berkelbacteria bacterium]